jgi:hypothetical protein
MYNKSFFKQVLLVASILLFVSCDKDYNAIGEGLIGQNHFVLKDTTFSVVAYNQKITAVESANLPVNALGIYDDPAFGKTITNFATQLALETLNPIIGNNPKITNVILSVPYFTDATQKVLNADGSSIYVLDSIYGAAKAKIKLSVFESGYFLRSLDPVGGFQTYQKYFTDQNADFNNLKIGGRLNDSTDVSQNDEFFFNPAEHVVNTTDAITNVVTTKRTAPSMQLNLNASFFKTKIIDGAAAGKLLTNDVFINYFRGLYFKVEQSGSDAGSLAMLNFQKGTISVNYTEDLSTTVGTVTTITRVAKSIILNMSGNTVSLPVRSNTNAAYAEALANSNSTLGDDRLYLKGGEGSMAVIDLFGPDTDNNGVADELEKIRNNKWLINEANLIFNIDASAMANSYEPQRIYLYDLNNNRPIIDFYTDGTSDNTNTKNTKLVFSGILNKEAVSNGRGLNYKVRITDQIRGLIKNNDSTNVKLGVVVTEEVSIVSSSKLKSPGSVISQVPRSSVMSSLGTILYGSKSSVPDSKRLKLQIFYTKPN